MRRRLVAIDLGTGMHHNLLGTAFGQRDGAVHRAIRAVVAQAHFRCHRYRCRNGAAHMLENTAQQFRLLEQHRTTARLVHGLGRATEVQVEHRRTQLAGQCCVFSQAHWVRAEQLHAQRYARCCRGTLLQLRRQLVELSRRQQHIVDPDELGDTPVDTADSRQHVTQDVVDQPLHRRQGNLHGNYSSEKGAQCSKSAPATPAWVAAADRLRHAREAGAIRRIRQLLLHQ
ncbi:hypothetical protein D9M71_500320 [compost metagenome]